ncbi:PREDICTED: bcl-2-associated transcription factor 1-like [Nelumbo nucifera]|uniref:Uncharacterized protein n=2 Tax=Nelumbo nucifera TaxID=4432 RepID=A0A822XHS0_NELNU|nr:PREDICTED: bcl-2-associated transcription factor 1-like [Nelumbo nucifera]DAD18355.1 TPA_asm: hypothetical protein HUJ06_019818 [Nelumbo nucifera]
MTSDTHDSTTKPVSQSMNMSSQSLSGVSMTTPPFPGVGVPGVNYAIALQQYYFQQSLLNRQLAAKQQAVAHAMSIKAAAEQAAARAAEISKLLTGETNDTPKEKVDSPKREHFESKSGSRSQSPRSSKSKSVSPPRKQSICMEQEEYSPKGRSRYRNHRHSTYYYHHDRDYPRSYYRRGSDRSRGGRDYLYYHRSRSRNRRRSMSILRSIRRRHDDSSSPRRRHIRSPSPRSGRKMSSRVSSRHGISRSPIKSSSTSLSPQGARVTSLRRPTASISLSFSGNSPSHDTTSPLANHSRGDRDASDSETNSAPKPDLKQQKKECTPLNVQLTRNECSNSSSRSRSISTNNSGERNVIEPRFKKAISGKYASVNENDLHSSRSDGESVQRASGATDERDLADSAQPRSNHNTVYPTSKLDHNLCKEDRIVSSRFDDGSTQSNEIKQHDLMKGVHEKGHMELFCVNRPSPSPEYSPLYHQDKKRYSVKEKENDASGNRVEEKKDDRKKFKHDQGTYSDHATFVENDENDNNNPKRQGDHSSHDVDLFEYPDNPGECAIFPLPEDDKNVDDRFQHCKRLGELSQEQEYDIKSHTLASGNVVTKHVLRSPDASRHPKGSKQQSRSRERRNHGKHHKRHQNDESEEDDYDRKEERNKWKLRKCDRKDHKRHHKSHKERARRKRKHRKTSPSSSDDSSSSDNDEYTKKNYKAPIKRSTDSIKKRRQSLSSSTSSSL